jgi:hypothetical protein
MQKQVAGLKISKIYPGDWVKLLENEQFTT